MKKWRPGITPGRRHKKFIIIQLPVDYFINKNFQWQK